MIYNHGKYCVLTIMMGHGLILWQVAEDIGNYDLIIGGIANDKVFRTIDLYFAGDITKQQALNKLVYEKPNIQLCIRSEQMLRQCLTLINSEKL